MKVRHWFMAALLATGVVAVPMMQVVTADDAAPAEAAVEAKQAEPAARKYWLGVQLAPTPEILKKHVERLKDGGAMVAGVAPESPADKAGLKAGDHILKVNEAMITSPEQMVDIVRDSDGKVLAVRVLRGLEIESYNVQPEEAPEDILSAMPQMNDAAGALGVPALPTQPGAHLRFFGPGQLVPPQVRLQALDQDMPQNMMIRVEKKGDGPTTLHIERDGKSWNATEETIDELPEDLRPIAKRYLAQGTNGHIIISGHDVPFIQLHELMKDMPLLPPGVQGPGPDMQQQMQQMQEMLRKMHERMERMQVAPPAAVQPAEDEV